MLLIVQRTFALCMLVLAASGASASDVYFEARSLDEALSFAKANHKLVVIDFWTVNCPPCRAFEKHVKENRVVRTALERLVLFKAELPALEELGKEYNVYLFPTYVLLNADGELLATWIGYYGPDDWAATVNEVVADPVTATERRARFEKSPSFKDAFRLGHVEYTQKRLKPAYDYLRRASLLDPQAARDAGVPLDLFRVTYWGTRSGELTAGQCMDAIAAVLTADDVDQEDALFVSGKVLGARRYFNDGDLIKILKMVHAAVPVDAEADEYGQLETFRIEYTFLVENDPVKATQLKRASLPEDWEHSYRGLNGFAWWCFEHKANLDEAEVMARRAAEMAPEGPHKSDCLDTLAEIVNLRGDTGEAIALTRRAIELDPDGPRASYYRRQLAKFEGVRDSASSP